MTAPVLASRRCGACSPYFMQGCFSSSFSFSTWHSWWGNSSSCGTVPCIAGGLASLATTFYVRSGKPIREKPRKERSPSRIRRCPVLTRQPSREHEGSELVTKPTVTVAEWKDGPSLMPKYTAEPLNQPTGATLLQTSLGGEVRFLLSCELAESQPLERCTGTKGQVAPGRRVAGFLHPSWGPNAHSLSGV